MDKERRKYVRVPVYMKVINETKESDFGFAYAKDISSGGIAFDTKIFLGEEFSLKKGTQLKLKFKIPGGRFYITVTGDVVRIDKDEFGTQIVGVKFTSVDKEFLTEIENFVSEVKKGNLSLEY